MLDQLNPVANSGGSRATVNVQAARLELGGQRLPTLRRQWVFGRRESTCGTRRAETQGTNGKEDAQRLLKPWAGGPRKMT